MIRKCFTFLICGFAMNCAVAIWIALSYKGSSTFSSPDWLNTPKQWPLKSRGDFCETFRPNGVFEGQAVGAQFIMLVEYEPDDLESAPIGHEARALLLKVGLPMRSFEGELWVADCDATDRVLDHREFFGSLDGHQLFGVEGRMRQVPLKPMVLGLIVNTAVYAMLLYGLLLMPPAIRRVLRRARTRCESCGYDLRATTSGCPECGWKRDDVDSK